MPQPASDFVATVMAAIGADGPTDLSRKLGLGEAGPKRVSRWLDGENEPDYEATMLMLEKAGMLKGPSRRKATAAESVGSPGPTLEELSGLVASIAETMGAGFAEVRNRLGGIERRLPPEPGQEQPKRAGGSK